MKTSSKLRAEWHASLRAKAAPDLPAQIARIPICNETMDGDLVVPPGAEGIVVFAHGSGSSRFSERNRAVAQELQARGLATLLFDLLTPSEAKIDEHTGALRLNIDLLTSRLRSATEWVQGHAETRNLRIGYFGASTGAAAALAAAAQLRYQLHAVVSRGGRPELAAEFLPRVIVPTLLVVGGKDPDVLQRNRAAYAELGGEKELVVIPDATHLFPEPGALQAVAEIAADWFIRHLIHRSGGTAAEAPEHADL